MNSKISNPNIFNKMLGSPMGRRLTSALKTTVEFKKLAPYKDERGHQLILITGD